MHVYLVRIIISTDIVLKREYLIIDGCDDGCPDPHTNGKAAMEVLVEEERLDHRRQEQENSIDIAMPVRITLILGEIDHQSAKVRNIVLHVFFYYCRMGFDYADLGCGTGSFV